MGSDGARLIAAALENDMGALKGFRIRAWTWTPGTGTSSRP